MASTEPGSNHDQHPAGHRLGANTDLNQLVAAAADLCRRPLRHGVLSLSPADGDDHQLRLEARDAMGERRPEQDLELEIFRSGPDLNLTLAWLIDDTRPMLWQGSHTLWFDSAGCRCPSPMDAAPLEALARRLRALLLSA